MKLLIRKIIPQFVLDFYHLLIALGANLYYGFPSRKMMIIGVTGTDGKTTTCNLIYNILRQAGLKVGLVSTVYAKIGDREIDTGFHTTTPDSWFLQRLLKKMGTEGIEAVVLETTSHALSQNRIWGINYDIAVLTNISPEHLDYHKTLDKYIIAKEKLFKIIEKSKKKKNIQKTIILNRDEAKFDVFNKYSARQKITYGIKNMSDVMAENIFFSIDGLKFLVKTYEKKFEIESPLVGEYNIYNILAAVCVGLSLNLSEKVIFNGIKESKYIPGRFERIHEGQDFEVIVDFAHTPDSLSKLLKLAKKININKGKIIIVFGSAGERDHLKRYSMGKITGSLADFVILTSEDPRHEDVNQIISAIEKGVVDAGKQENSTYFKIIDRRKAIGKAFEIAGTGDIILITGKGHEQSLAFGDQEIPWDDRQVAREELRIMLDRKTAEIIEIPKAEV